MADILIRGMEMPHDCDECKLCAFIPVGEYGLERKCMPLNRNAEITIRRKDCPLVKLQKHGDLIDRDAMLEGKDDGYWDLNDLPDYAETLHVIIPANKEETE